MSAYRGQVTLNKYFGRYNPVTIYQETAYGNCFLSRGQAENFLAVEGTAGGEVVELTLHVYPGMEAMDVRGQ